MIVIMNDEVQLCYVYRWPTWVYSSVLSGQTQWPSTRALTSVGHGLRFSSTRQNVDASTTGQHALLSLRSVSRLIYYTLCLLTQLCVANWQRTEFYTAAVWHAVRRWDGASQVRTTT